MDQKFATCLTCMDGRIQLPLIYWIKKSSAVDCVDMITEAGIDGRLADPDYDIENILEKVHISVSNHQSRCIYICGHHDCAGNPGEYTMHKRHILAGVERIKNIIPTFKVVGLWVNQSWQVEEIT